MKKIKRRYVSNKKQEAECFKKRLKKQGIKKRLKSNEKPFMVSLFLLHLQEIKLPLLETDKNRWAELCTNNKYTLPFVSI